MKSRTQSTPITRGKEIKSFAGTAVLHFGIRALVLLVFAPLREELLSRVGQVGELEIEVLAELQANLVAVVVPGRPLLLFRLNLV